MKSLKKGQNYIFPNQDVDSIKQNEDIIYI